MNYQLGYRSQYLSAISRAVKNVLSTSETTDHQRLILLSICAPILAQSGFNLGRVAVMSITSQTIRCDFGIGTKQEATNTKARGLVDRALCAPDKCVEILREAQQLAAYLRDHATVPYSKQELEASILNDALQKQSPRLVNASGVEYETLSDLDRRIARACQDGLQSVPFAYIPIPTVAPNGPKTSAFLYVDSPFASDDPLTTEVLESIWRFASIIGFLWSLDHQRESTNELIRFIAHDTAHLLRTLVRRTNKLTLTQAYYRAESVMQAYTPNRRFSDRLVQKVDLDKAFKRMVAFTRQQIANRLPRGLIEVTTPRPTGLIIKGNEQWFDTIIGQLLDNAVKYGQTKGEKVTITLNASAAEDLAEPMIVVEVSDTGPGMPTDIPTEDLFFRPVRCNRTVEGAGIGLLTCKRLLDAWVGDKGISPISYSSKPGQGTTFKLLLPKYCSIRKKAKR